MSDYRSFGSNYHPSSQSRKISIGVMADSQPRRNPVPEKGDGDVIARVEKLKSATVPDLQARKKDLGNLAGKQRTSAQATEHVTSPWRSPRSSHRKLGTLENVLSKQTSCSSGRKGSNKGLNGAHQAAACYSFKKVPSSSPQHSHGELNGGRNDEGMNRSPERIEEPPSAVLPQTVVSQREETDKPEKEKNGGTAVLRSKLWEILGKVSPANNQDVNSETPEVVKTNFKLSQDKGSNNDPLIKPRHNSESIETDSTNPDNATRRPVTRSLLQRRVGAKGVQKRTKAGTILARKSVEHVNNIFSFEEGLRGKANTAKVASDMPKKQKGRTKNTVVQCRKAHSRKKDETDGIQKETSKRNTPPRSENMGTSKRSSFSDKKRSSHEVHQQSKSWKQKPDISRNEDVHPLPEAATAATPEMFQGLNKNGDKQEKPSNVYMEKSVEPDNEFQSPTFGYKAPISSHSQCFSPEVSPLQPRNISPILDETETPIFSFGTKKIPQGPPTGQASNTERRLPDFLEKKRVYSFRRESSAEPNEDLVLSDSSSDERDSDGSGDLSMLGHYNSPEEKETANWSNEKSKLGSSSAKRKSNLKATGRVVLSPPSSLSTGIYKTDFFQHCSEMDEDEGLGRAVALFSLALQNFEKKLKASAEKKSLEIITSVSEEIHLELENVKSHIVTEAAKKSNLAKTKRKHAETTLQEQQEKMRIIHEKFKDDVSHHLEDFKSTIEGLETDHSELKGSIKKQRTSHQKLIAHFEGDIETKLDNATKRIDSVNKSARGKMQQLKMIVAECLKDVDVLI